MSDDLNALDRTISDRGFFERILREREKFDEERDRRIDERFDALSKALELQAAEYARRLHDLNGEYQRDRARQHEYVTTDKWETTNEGEKIARETALLRVDEKFGEFQKTITEKFDGYVLRYEQRQREVDLLIAAQSGAAEEAKRAVEEAVRKSDAQARDQARRQNRNLGLASLGLGVIVFVANLLPYLTK